MENFIGEALHESERLICSFEHTNNSQVKENPKYKEGYENAKLCKMLFSFLLKGLNKI